MAANKSVIVLTPNGRRQNVKVTPNSTILQILEEVCQKHGFNVDDYNLKHFNHVLDPNAIMRFTGLSNNAQLEMVFCTKVRQVSDVTIGIQMENGKRLTGEFAPETTLAEVLRCLQLDQDLDKTILIYMHREVYGIDVFEKTSLKSLGLTCGRAIIRLLIRNPEQLKRQAHVAAPLTPKLPKASEVPVASTSGSSNIDGNKGYQVSADQSSKILDRITATSKEEVVKELEKSGQVDTRKKTDGGKKSAAIGSEGQTTSTSLIAKNKILTKAQGEDLKEIESPKIIFLGERNALAFNQASAEALPREELPENFYDLTVNDAKVLLRDAIRVREELEEAPLMTDTLRQFYQEQKTLSQLNKYQRTVIRIQFPDQFVLQGLFSPLETVQTVKDFIKNYLINSNSEFDIYTTPPKYVLKPEARLVEENLVPSAIVYYSGASALRPNIKEKVTDPRAAGIQAIRVRRETRREENQDVKKEEEKKNSAGISNSMRNASTSGSSSRNQNVTPKWFNQLSK